jgi:thermitase
MYRQHHILVPGLILGLVMSGCGAPVAQFAQADTVQTKVPTAPVAAQAQAAAPPAIVLPVLLNPPKPDAPVAAPVDKPVQAAPAAPIALPALPAVPAQPEALPPTELVDGDTPKDAPEEAADFAAKAPANVPNQIVVGVKPGMSLARKVQALGSRTISSVDVGVTYKTIELPTGMSVEDGMKLYANDPAVATAAPNRVYNLSATWEPNDPRYGDQWGFKQINGAHALARGIDARGITVAVLDTGVDYNHPDLAGRVMIGWNFANGNKDVMDRFGHGTHVSGIIAASANNGIGTAGVCPSCNIMAIKVLGDNGEGSTSTVLEGIKYAADYGARIINMSLGSSDTTIDPALAQGIAYARSRGCLVVAAAGNNRGDVGSPANDPGALAVSSTSKFLWWEYLSWYSNRGAKVAVAAPGGGIWSLAPLNSNRLGKTGYAKLSGTSMAAPFVAGEAALIMAQNRYWTADNVAGKIMSAVDDKGSTGRDPKYGYGRIRLDLAVQ